MNAGRQIYSMALDIKVPEDAPIQILEFMPSYMAGYKGYHQLHGLDMTTDLIIPYLEETFNKPVEQIGYWHEDIPLSMLGYSYGHDIAANGSGIVYPRRDDVDAPGGGSIVMTRADLHFAKNHPEFTFVGADQQMLLIQDNKAAQACLVAEDTTLSEFYAPTHLTTTAYDPDKADSIVSDLGLAEYYVLKPVDQTQGNGVRIVHANALDKTLRHLLIDLRQHKKSKDGRDFWKSDISPVMIVQPYIPSRPIKQRGHMYDGTLRTFVSVHRENPGDEWQVEIHDGYWKLPLHPLKKGNPAPQQMVSHSPSRTEKFGSKNETSWHRKMQSAPLAIPLCKEIFPQVAEFCEHIPTVLEKKSLYQRTWHNLVHRSPVRQAAGVSMALHGEYYPGNIHDPLPLNRNEFPASIYKRIKHLCLKDDFEGAVGQYIAALMKPGLDGYDVGKQYFSGSQHYVPWGLLMRLEEDEKFQEALKTRNKQKSSKLEL